MAEKQLIDGAWYWVRFETGFKDEWTQAPAMYKAGGDAWYSFLFAGIPARRVEVLGKIDAPAPAEPAASATQAGAANVIATAPTRIWLDLGDDVDSDANFKDLEEVTWSSNNASGGGVKYVRADVANPAAPVVLPEPFVIATTKRESPTRRTVEFEWGPEALEDEGVHKLYTEQQVHTLLTSLAPPAPAAVAVPDERTAFEAVASDNGKWPKAIEHDSKGNYFLMGTASGWTWWQARAALAATPAAKAEVQAEPVAWMYSFTHSSAIGHGDHDIGPVVTKDRKAAFGVGCFDQQPLFTSPQATQQDAIDAAKWRFVQASPDHAVCAMDHGHGWYAVTDAAIQAAQQGGSDA